MDYSRRETLALGGGVAGGLLTGGLIGVGARRLDADGAVGGDGDEPMQRIVGTRDDESVETGCDAVVGDENVVELGDRRTRVVGPLAPDKAAGPWLRRVHGDRPAVPGAHLLRQGARPVPRRVAGHRKESQVSAARPG